jgi:thiol:disulfide interchange protein
MRLLCQRASDSWLRRPIVDFRTQDFVARSWFHIIKSRAISHPAEAWRIQTMTSIRPRCVLGCLLAVPFLLLLSWLPAYGQQDDFLPPEQAYRFNTRGEPETIVVSWTIAPGYYLYKKRLSFESDTPGVTLGTPIFPNGDSHHDEFFGTQEVYRGAAVILIPVKFTGQHPSQLRVKIRWQGCADAGLCYPPTTWETTVPMTR